MKLFKLTLILVLFSGINAILVHASKVPALIDDLKIDKLASEVCENDDIYHRQIGRVSTIVELAKYLEKSNKLSSCKSKYEESISRLSVIVSDSKNGLCSTEKLSLLEKYHRDYVSTISKFKDIRKEAKKVAPQLIKLFFMQYAIKVSTQCSEYAANFLIKSKEYPSELEDRLIMRELMREMGALESNISSLKSYDDIFLIWNLMDSLPSKLSSKMNKYIEFGKETKVTVEVSDIDNAIKIHDICMNNAKPFYSIGMLSFVRLSDLGYYPESSVLLKQIHNDEFTRVIYALTMLCEDMLPIRFAHNSAIPSGRMVMIELRKAVEKYGPVPEERLIKNLATSGPARMPDDIITISPQDAYSHIKSIKSQVKSRGKIIKQTLKKIEHTIKKMPALTLELLVIGKTGGPVKEYVSQVDEHDIPGIIEETTEVE